MKQNEYLEIVRFIATMSLKDKNIMVTVNHNNQIYSSTDIQFNEQSILICGTRFIPVSRIDEIAVYEVEQ